MDAAGVVKGVLSLNADDEKEFVAEALEKYPGKFVLNAPINPIERGIMNEIRRDKILWGTAYPIVTFKRSLDDVEQLPLRDHVRPKYLGENALSLFNFG